MIERRKYSGAGLLLAGLLAVAAFLFWMLVLPFHICYQEQALYFPYTAGHLLESLSFPGGIALLVGDFFTQFFIKAWAGALVMAVLTAGVQVMTAKVMHCTEDAALLPLSAVPAVCCWAFICDLGSLLSGPVALCLALGAWLLVEGRGRVWAFALVPVVYWLAGPMAYVFVSLAVIDALRCGGKPSWCTVSALLAEMLLTLLAAVLVCRQYPVRRLCLGVLYNHMPDRYTYPFYLMIASVPVVAVIAALLRRERRRKPMPVFALLLVLVAAGSFFYIRPVTDKERESVYAYDISAMHRDWDSIVKMAQKKVPGTPGEVTCLNLALVMKGLSGDMLLNFRQAGIQGLFPNYDSYMLLKVPGAEALYQAGLLNMALHYSFEAYQTVPGFRESARHLKRLAEINMITGNRAIADKYLKALSSTLFYGRWAKAHLADPSLAASDPEYSRLMEYNYSGPEIYDDMEEFPKQLALRKLVKERGKADFAYHYLLTYDLLAKDGASFLEDFYLAPQQGPVPVIYQQALAFSWLAGGCQGDVDCELVSDEVASLAKSFLKDISTKNVSYMRSHYGKTYWFYYANNK